MTSSLKTREALAAALSTALGPWAKQRRARLRLLPSTESGRSVAFVVGPYIAKAPLDGVFHDEKKAQKQALAAGAPKLVACKPIAALGFLQEKLAGKAKEAWSDDDVSKVAERLAQLHARPAQDLRPLPGGATIQATFNDARHAIKLLSTHKMITAAAAKEVKEAIEAGASSVGDVLEFGADPPQVLCHGDVRSPNVYFSGALARFIDYGLAGRGDAAIDLARTVGYARMSLHQQFVFFDAYARACDDDAAVDRAIPLARVMPRLLALNAARYVCDVVRGVVVVGDAEAVVGRLPGISARLGVSVKTP